MPLTLRRTGLNSPAYKDWLDYTVYEDGEAVGRIYEDRGIGTPPGLQWFWSITVYVDPQLGIATAGSSDVGGSEGGVSGELGEMPGSEQVTGQVGRRKQLS